MAETIIPRDELDIAQAEGVLGARFYDNDAIAERINDVTSAEAKRTAQESPARARIFADILRTQALQREGAPIDQDLVAHHQRYLAALKNLEGYVSSEQIDTDLHGHQVGVFEDIYHFLNGTHPVDAGETFSFERRGYVEMPTSSGKTVIYVKLIEEMRRGLLPAERPAALVLVPSRTTRGQVMGEEEDKGFARLSADSGLKVTGYTGRGYDASGDIIVMTYQAFVRSRYQRELAKRNIDVVVCDEAHNAIGEQTAKEIEEFARDKVLLGFTATAKFAENHTVEKVFRKSIHEMSFREAAELGVIHPIQGYIYDTEVEIALDPSSTDFTQAEFDRILQAEGHTEKGVEFAAALVARGLRGSVSCVPGENCAQAHDVADRLRRMTVTRPDGLTRVIRAVALDGTMSAAYQREVLQAYHRGAIDVICYVNLLIEGWDEDKNRFSINLRPTSSERLYKQRLGRVARTSEDDPASVVIDFYYRTNKTQQTYLQAYDLAELEQGRIFYPHGLSEEAKRQLRVTLPDWMRQEIEDVDTELLYHGVVKPSAGPVPEDYLSFRELALALELPYIDVSNAAKRLRLDPERYIGRKGRLAYHLDPEQQALVREYFASGGQIKITAPVETEPKQKTLIEEFSDTVQRVMHELDVQEDNGERWVKFQAESGYFTVYVGQEGISHQPRTDPDDRWVIRIEEKVPQKVGGDEAKEKTYKYALLEDGRLLRARYLRLRDPKKYIDDLWTELTWGEFLDLGYGTVVKNTPVEAEPEKIREFIRVMQEQLPPPVDWDAVDLPVMRRITASQESDWPHIFEPNSENYKVESAGVLERGLAFMMLVDQRGYTAKGISQELGGLKTASVSYSIKKAREALAQNDPFAQTLYRTLRRSLPRKQTE